jgi:hypothetical protein
MSPARRIAARHHDDTPLTSTDTDHTELAALTPELIAALDSDHPDPALLPPPPADLVARWDAALAALPPVVPAQPVPAPVRRLSGRRAARWVGGLAAAAAVAALAVLALPGPAVPAPTPGALPALTGPMALTSKDLPMGGQDYGPLRDPARRAGCLAHAGAPGATVLGARQVDWAGRPGVLLVLPAGEPGRLRVLVVSPDCAADRGEVLADTPVGR